MSKFKKYSEPRDWDDNPDVFDVTLFRKVRVTLYHWAFPPADVIVRNKRSLWIRLRKHLTLEVYW